MASRKSHKDIVELLIQKEGIKINQKNNKGETALYVASEFAFISSCNEDDPLLRDSFGHDHKEIVQILVKTKEININEKNNDGDTALHLASRFHLKEIIQILVEAKEINLNQKNNDGMNALQMANFDGDKEMVALLTKLINKKIERTLYNSELD